MSRQMPIFGFACILTIVITAGAALGQATLTYTIVTNSDASVIADLTASGPVDPTTGLVAYGQVLQLLPNGKMQLYTNAPPPAAAGSPPQVNAVFAFNGALTANVSFAPNPSAPGTYNGVKATTDPPSVSFTVSNSPKTTGLAPRQAVQDPNTGLWKLNLALGPGDWYYNISAHNGWGTAGFNGAHIQIVKPLTAGPTAVTVTTAVGGITANWPAVAGAAGYSLKVATSAGGPFTVAQFPVNGTTATVTNLTPNTTYYVVVSALNGGGESPNSSNPVSVLTPPAVPTNVSMSMAVIPNTLSLMWMSSLGATSYLLNLGGVNVTATAAAANCPPNVQSMCIYGAGGFPGGTQTSCSVAAVNASGGQSAFSGAVFCAAP